MVRVLITEAGCCVYPLACHSVVFALWLIKVLCCRGRLFTVRCVLLLINNLLKMVILDRNKQRVIECQYYQSHWTVLLNFI
jgi:hypothetical protein